MHRVCIALAIFGLYNCVRDDQALAEARVSRNELQGRWAAAECGVDAAAATAGVQQTEPHATTALGWPAAPAAAAERAAADVTQARPLQAAQQPVHRPGRSAGRSAGALEAASSSLAVARRAHTAAAHDVCTARAAALQLERALQQRKQEVAAAEHALQAQEAAVAAQHSQLCAADARLQQLLLVLPAAAGLEAAQRRHSAVQQLVDAPLNTHHVYTGAAGGAGVPAERQAGMVAPGGCVAALADAAATAAAVACAPAGQHAS